MKKGILQVVTCYVLWGILPIFWKNLSCLNAVYVLASRIVWSVVFCFLMILLQGNLDELKQTLCDKKQMRTLACSGVMVAVNWGCYIYAVNEGHIVDASLAYYLNPLLSIAIGYLLFRERLSCRQWIAIAIAGAGIVGAIVLYREVPVFALIIATSFAIYGAIKKHVRCSGMVSTFVEVLVLAPIALVCLGWMELCGMGAFGRLEGIQWCLLPVAGVVTSVPLLAYSAGIPKVSMSLAGMLMYINPTLQLLIGILLYGERFDLPNLLMFVCVWIAILLFVYDNGKKRKKN